MVAGPVVGVLDLQGDVREHLAALAEVGCPARTVKRPADLEGLAGLVLPGGESTTLSMLLESTGLFEAIAERVTDLGPSPSRSSRPVPASCWSPERSSTDARTSAPSACSTPSCAATATGARAQSFEADLVFGSGEGPLLPTVFIRAPLLVSVGEDVDVLATLDGVPVLVRQGLVLASCFHPELTPDRRIHGLFAAMCGSDGPGGLFG